MLVDRAVGVLCGPIQFIRTTGDQTRTVTHDNQKPLYEVLGSVSSTMIAMLAFKL